MTEEGGGTAAEACEKDASECDELAAFLRAEKRGPKEVTELEARASRRRPPRWEKNAALAKDEYVKACEGNDLDLRE